MDIFSDILPILIIVLVAFVNFVKASKTDSSAPRGNELPPDEDSDPDFNAAAEMVREMKERAARSSASRHSRGDSDGLPRTVGGIELAYDDESGDEKIDAADFPGETFQEASETHERAAAAQPSNGGGSIDYGARLRDVTESDAYKMGSPASMVQREAENFVPRSWDSFAEGDLEHSSENGGGVFGVALDSADDLRKAFVMSEIVSKPLSLRDDSERFAVW